MNGKAKPFLDISSYEQKDSSVQRDIEIYGEKMSIRLNAEKNLLYFIVKEQKEVLILLYVFNLLLPILYIHLLYKSLHDRVGATQKCLEHMKESMRFCRWKRERMRSEI